MKAFFARGALALTLASTVTARGWAAESSDTHAPSAAEDEQPVGDTKEENPNFAHAKQFGLRAGLVGAYRMVLRYDESPLCAEIDVSKGQDQQKFCGYAAPFALDLSLSGALNNSFEPFLWARFGLKGEEDTNTSPMVLLGVGARLYTVNDSKVKVFVEPAIGLELDGKGDSTDPLRAAAEDDHYKTDLQFHLAAGPQFDLSKNFGLYLDAGLTLGILRYLHSTLELTFGVQGRLP